MSDEPRPNYKHENETKVRLDDEYEAALVSLAKVHRTRKAVLAREALESWIDGMREEIKRSSHVA
ncbi:hypothetical protein [Pseudomonas fluorescens]|jgi:predicted transcriptional regulator|uniref:Uncharacterized protein n=1 Tax=Pseudomonas fluorescens TaxID=294 RepID=A0A5E7Q501_PSEFL|nr:hypothetical protein [Pseudomonas fluorescens]VVP56904.1 hypothetical protein PS880_05764 [Pseudomonas fluorescens]